MKRLGLSVGLAVLLCGAMSALASAAGFSFTTVIFPGDTFTQLLGINDFDLIAGYHGATVNKGFVFTPPNHFTAENFPGSAQTQVVAINNFFKTAGFYITTGGVTHGFLRTSGGTFSTVDFPGTGFNQLLGLNVLAQAVGYFADPPGFTLDHPYIFDQNGAVFLQIVIPLATKGAQATGINDQEEVCGFYIDSGGVTHGFLLNAGTLTTLNFPGASFTQALGLNDQAQVVGVYMVGTATQDSYSIPSLAVFGRSMIPMEWEPRRSTGSTTLGRLSGFTSTRWDTRTALLARRSSSRLSSGLKDFRDPRSCSTPRS